MVIAKWKLRSINLTAKSKCLYCSVLPWFVFLVFLPFSMKKIFWSKSLNWKFRKKSFWWWPFEILPFPPLSPCFPPSRSRNSLRELKNCGWRLFQALIALTMTHKSYGSTGIDILNLIDVKSRWGIDQIFSLLLNWLMGEISTNIQSMILYVCRTI